MRLTEKEGVENWLGLGVGGGGGEINKENGAWGTGCLENCVSCKFINIYLSTTHGSHIDHCCTIEQFYTALEPSVDHLTGCVASSKVITYI